MRSFVDEKGGHWQAALLAASYGNMMLVFSPLGGGEIRHCPLAVTSMADAMAELEALDEDGLRVLLASSVAWDSEVGAI